MLQAFPYDRMVAWELVQLAWSQEGENWVGETLDLRPYNLPEPPPGEVWDRTRFSLPRQGTLRVTYVSTKRTPKLQDVVSEALFAKLMHSMSTKGVLDGGLGPSPAIHRNKHVLVLVFASAHS